MATTRIVNWLAERRSTPELAMNRVAKRHVDIGAVEIEGIAVGTTSPTTASTAELFELLHQLRRNALSEDECPAQSANSSLMNAR